MAQQEKYIVYAFSEKGLMIPAPKKEFNSQKEADDYIRNYKINGMVAVNNKHERV